MQHELLRELGEPVQHRIPEGWPKKCPKTNAIFKAPTNSVRQVEKMLKLRKNYPNIRFVFMVRDIPNTLWSLYKRTHGVSFLETLTEEFQIWTKREHQKICNIRKAWEEKGEERATVDLRSFTLRTKGVMDTILKGIEVPNHRRKRKMQRIGIPSSNNHEKRREWQATHPVYTNNYELFKNETSLQVVARLESLASC